ncbi:DUF3885 domain-containing protein [Deinococcus sp. QL22]|uniref:DUF3885 domain-containing protein n=1 Tax=Deinococcus sp. QL22 TaxID=2939437 RepID=UPI002017218B|nr:DUF3885 domain-containing protein [Deinococcus sp. QL22]UQN06960.1 DUF3885 domain-containing protein [Deinococcus sp. QL22]
MREETADYWTQIQNVFGAKAFTAGLFYEHPSALRFELSRGGSYLEMFTRAYDLSRTILAQAFGSSPRLLVALSYFSEPPGPTRSQRRTFKQALKACGVLLPSDHQEVCLVHLEEDGHLLSRVFVLFEIQREELHLLLWGVLASELGIRPRLQCSLYIANIFQSLLAHPYDDRGMDLIAPDASLLAGLYQVFNANLLDFDRERMDKTFLDC